MKKFTRRAHNRKLIMFAVSIFMAIGMISTGFAAWVMSVNSEKNADAPVQVGIVTDASMEVSIDQWTKVGDATDESWTGDVLRFDAAEETAHGRIRPSADSEEKLTMVISGKVKNAADNLGSLTMTIDLPDEIVNAISAGYIKVSGQDSATLVAANGVITLSYTDDALGTNDTLTYNVAEGSKDATFTHTLTFEWGSFFGNVNPAVFYDSETASASRTTSADGEPQTQQVTGKSIADATMKTEMEAFYNLITAGASNTEGAYAGMIDITVVASAD